MPRFDPSRRRFVQLGCAACGCAASHLVCPSAHARRRKLAEPSAQTLAENKGVVANLKGQRVSLGWDWIVVHHTATGGASVAGLDAYHKRRFDDELGAEYHFVINNGVKGPDGAIQLARWRHQAAAAHLFHPERAPASLAIVLVGNFESSGAPSGAQMIALGRLTRALQAKFKIKGERVTTHTGIDGRLTQCPGKDFSLAELQRRLL